jgi:hypothetical protein
MFPRMTEIRVRMGKVLPVLTIVCAGVQLLVFSTNRNPLFGVVAVLLLAVGILQMFSTMFVVSFGEGGGGEVQMKNPLGMTVWRHPFGSVHDLTVDGNKLHVLRTDGKRKSVGGFAADAGDIAKLAAALNERRAA